VVGLPAGLRRALLLALRTGVADGAVELHRVPGTLDRTVDASRARHGRGQCRAGAVRVQPRADARLPRARLGGAGAGAPGLDHVAAGRDRHHADAGARTGDRLRARQLGLDAVARAGIGRHGADAGADARQPVVPRAADRPRVLGVQPARDGRDVPRAVAVRRDRRRIRRRRRARCRRVPARDAGVGRGAGRRADGAAVLAGAAAEGSDVTLQDPGASGPVPDWLAERFVGRDGLALCVRPLGPADAANERAFIEGLSPESLYQRLMGVIKGVSDEQLAALLEPDWPRSVALAIFRCDATAGAREDRK